MILVSNFKQNLTSLDYQGYLQSIAGLDHSIINKNGLTYVLAPPMPYLEMFYKTLKNIENIFISAQDVSSFSGGSHTGEVSAKQLRDFVDFCIVGHSERRLSQNENYKTVNLKIDNLIKFNIKPIVCFSNLEQLTNIENLSSVILAYEPIDYIGGSDAISNKDLKNFYLNTGLSQKILYGGSVNSKNILRFVDLDFISGFLVGGASLNFTEMAKIIDLLVKVKYE